MPLYYGETHIGGAAIQVVNPVLQNKRLTPSNKEQIAVPDAGYDGLNKVTVDPVPAVVQAAPSISVDATGLITAFVSQEGGYVSAGEKATTKQLTTKGATTITPTSSEQTAVNSNIYTTGAIKVGAIPSDYIMPSGTKSITENGTHDVTEFASVDVNVAGSGGSGAVETCTVTIHLVISGSRNASFTYIQNGALVTESRSPTDGVAVFDEVFNVDKNTIFCITNTLFFGPDVENYATITNGSFLIKTAGGGVAFTVESNNVTMQIG